MKIDKYKYDGKKKYKSKDFLTNETGEFKEKFDAMELFYENLNRINELQQSLYADRKEGVVFIFQAMDAAGKDGAIRAVLSCLSPLGVSETSFKQPTKEELAHDYLWRFWKALPEKGCISIFNRSYYEDVLVAKVHKLYENQACAERCKGKDIIKQRYKQIKNFEQYLYENSTRVVKIFLNVSKEEQAKRFISRIDIPRKNWKISESDIAEREYWDDYQEAFESAINATSTKDSPWYIVPADHKWYARLVISQIIVDTLEEMSPKFPVVAQEDIEKMEHYRWSLIGSLPNKMQKKYLKKMKDDKDKLRFEAGVMSLPMDVYMDAMDSMINNSDSDEDNNSDSDEDNNSEKELDLDNDSIENENVDEKIEESEKEKIIEDTKE